MKTVDLQIDLYSDWTAQVLLELKRLGYTVPPGTDSREVALLYFNALFRRIPQKPRKILKSHEFQCPPNLQTGLSWLEQKIKNGDDLNPHLSRKSGTLDYDDALLNDWRIFHFHLGTTYYAQGKNKGLVVGTDPVLFARVTDDAVYEICMGSHHNGWADLNWLEIIHRNWPKSIEPFKQPNALALSNVIDRATIETLRAGKGKKAGKINAPIQTQDGTIYAQFGGGYARDGRSLVVVMTVNQRISEIRQLEKWVRNNTALFLTDLKKLGFNESKPLKGDFVIGENGWYIQFPEWHYKVKIKATTIRTL